LLLFVLQGCGTIEGFSNRDGESSVYVGLRRDIEHITGARHAGSSCLDLSGLFLPFYIIDLPLSFGMDTVLLPYIFVSEVCFPPRPPIEPNVSGENERTGDK
jgi:uncharacterized protein YceK